MDLILHLHYINDLHNFDHVAVDLKHLINLKFHPVSRRTRSHIDIKRRT